MSISLRRKVFEALAASFLKARPAAISSRKNRRFFAIFPVPLGIYNRNSHLVLTTRTIPRPLELENRPVRANFLLWPNLLTLQAPVVAVLWQVLLAHSLHLKLDTFAPWALGLAVWLIYVSDHLMDTARPRPDLPEPPRKAFSRRHRDKFLVIAIVVASVLAAGVIRFLWEIAARVGWQISVGVACYFALIHFTPPHWRGNWPREMAVAVIFTLGTFAAVWFDLGQNTAPLLWPAALFAALVCTNCSLIETWEWEETPNPVARLVAHHLIHIGVIIALASAALALADLIPSPFAAASSISGLGFALLAFARSRQKLPIRFISPVADLILCSPLLVLLWQFSIRL